MWDRWRRYCGPFWMATTSFCIRTTEPWPSRWWERRARRHLLLRSSGSRRRRLRRPRLLYPFPVLRLLREARPPPRRHRFHLQWNLQQSLRFRSRRSRSRMPRQPRHHRRLLRQIRSHSLPLNRCSPQPPLLNRGGPRPPLLSRDRAPLLSRGSLRARPRSPAGRQRGDFNVLSPPIPEHEVTKVEDRRTDIRAGSNSHDPAGKKKPDLSHTSKTQWSSHLKQTALS